MTEQERIKMLEDRIEILKGDLVLTNDALNYLERTFRLRIEELERKVRDMER